MQKTVAANSVRRSVPSLLAFCDAGAAKVVELEITDGFESGDTSFWSR